MVRAFQPAKKVVPILELTWGKQSCLQAGFHAGFFVSERSSGLRSINTARLPEAGQKAGLQAGLLAPTTNLEYMDELLPLAEFLPKPDVWMKVGHLAQPTRTRYSARSE